MYRYQHRQQRPTFSRSYSCPANSFVPKTPPISPNGLASFKVFFHDTMERLSNFPEPLDYVMSVYDRCMQQMKWIGNESVLEVGCWTGKCTKEALLPLCQKRFAQIEAVDRCSEAIDFAAFHNAHRDITYTQVDITDPQSLPKSMQHRFSKVFTSCYSARLFDSSRRLEMLRAFTTDGAECVIVQVTQCPLFPTVERLAQSQQWKPYMRDYECLIPKQYQWRENAMEESISEAKKAGFTAKDSCIGKATLTFDTKQQFKGYLSTTIPFASRIPQGKREQFLEEALEIAMENGCSESPSGNILYPLTLMTLLLQKVRD